jgi:dihydrofolate reductase
MKLSLIVARSYDNVIGIDGKLPWDCPEDLLQFKEITSGPNKAVVMGRNTWESLPKKPLPGRLNIVVTSNPKNVTVYHDDLFVVRSLATAIGFGRMKGIEEMFFIGGKAIYDEAINLVDEIHLTEMHWDTKSDNDRDGERVYFDHDFPYTDSSNAQPWSVKDRVTCLRSGTGEALFDYMHLVRK